MCDAYSSSTWRLGFGDSEYYGQRSYFLSIEALAMNRYIPITGVDCTPATLLIDTQAPLDVLSETAAYRIRAVTQLLENIAFREELSSDAVVPHDFALLLAIPLRNGCDVLDVIGRRLQTQAMA